MSNLQAAVETYAFSVLALGTKIQATKAGIHQFEDRIQSAFREELGELVVCISLDAYNEVKITLV